MANFVRLAAAQQCQAGRHQGGVPKPEMDRSRLQGRGSRSWSGGRGCFVCQTPGGSVLAWAAAGRGAAGGLGCKGQNVKRNRPLRQARLYRPCGAKVQPRRDRSGLAPSRAVAVPHVRPAAACLSPFWQCGQNGENPSAAQTPRPIAPRWGLEKNDDLRRRVTRPVGPGYCILGRWPAIRRQRMRRSFPDQRLRPDAWSRSTPGA